MLIKLKLEKRKLNRPLLWDAKKANVPYNGTSGHIWEKNMLRYLMVIICFLLILGCASGTQLLGQIDPGMTPAQVEELMGKRDGFSSVEREGHKYMLYQYVNRYCNAHISLHDKCDFYVIFKDNEVIETGVKDVRSNSPNMQFLYIFKQP